MAPGGICAPSPANPYGSGCCGCCCSFGFKLALLAISSGTDVGETPNGNLPWENKT